MYMITAYHIVLWYLCSLAFCGIQHISTRYSHTIEQQQHTRPFTAIYI